jgi:GNAT superfamily N-acetyltransferase
MFFGRDDVDNKVVSVASLLLADPIPETWDDELLSGEASEDWDTSCACTTAREWDSCTGNKLTFLFVLPRYQKKGYGRQILEFVERYAWTRSNLPMKLESSKRAVDFFTRRGYSAVGDPIECTHPSSSLFRTLQKMIKTKK